MLGISRRIIISFLNSVWAHWPSGQPHRAFSTRRPACPPPPRNRIREPTGGAKNTGRARPSAGGCSQPATCVRACQSEGGWVFSVIQPSSFLLCVCLMANIVYLFNHFPLFFKVTSPALPRLSNRISHVMYWCACVCVHV